LAVVDHSNSNSININTSTPPHNPILWTPGTRSLVVATTTAYGMLQHLIEP